MLLKCVIHHLLHVWSVLRKVTFQTLEVIIMLIRLITVYKDYCILVFTRIFVDILYKRIEVHYSERLKRRSKMAWNYKTEKQNIEGRSSRAWKKRLLKASIGIKLRNP